MSTKSTEQLIASGEYVPPISAEAIAAAQADDVDRAFSGYGVALRRENDPPIPGEPLMSMADAKRITRELLARFAPSPDRERVAEWTDEARAECIAFEEKHGVFVISAGDHDRTCERLEAEIGRLEGLLALTAADPIVREGFVLVPVDPGTCELDDSGFLLAFVRELHSNAREAPVGWSDFSDEQRERIKAGWRALISAAPVLSGRGEWRDIASAPKDQIIMAWPCEIDGGAIVAVPASWYVHPSVQGWVTDVIDCSDYEFEPTHWLPAPPAKPSGVGEQDHGS